MDLDAARKEATTCQAQAQQANVQLEQLMARFGAFEAPKGKGSRKPDDQ